MSESLPSDGLFISERRERKNFEEEIRDQIWWKIFVKIARGVCLDLRFADLLFLGCAEVFCVFESPAPSRIREIGTTRGEKKFFGPVDLESWVSKKKK